MEISIKMVYNTLQFSWIFHPFQIIFIYYKLRIEDDNDKFRPEWVNISNILPYSGIPHDAS